MVDFSRHNGMSIRDFLAPLGVSHIEEIDDPAKAMSRLDTLFQESVERLIDAVRKVQGGADPKDAAPLEVDYPLLAIDIVDPATPLKHPEIMEWSYGWPSRDGVHGTTVTRPDITCRVILPTLERLRRIQQEPFLVAKSGVPMSPTYALRAAGYSIPEALQVYWKKITQLTTKQVGDSNTPIFDDQTILQGLVMTELQPYAERALRLPVQTAMFRHSATEIDFLAGQLEYQTGVALEHVQNLVAFVNYDKSLDVIAEMAQEHVGTQFEQIVCYPNQETDSSKSPKYASVHLTCSDGNGISVFVVGEGPKRVESAVKELAWLRPVFFFLGKAAILRLNCLPGVLMVPQSASLLKDSGIIAPTNFIPPGHLQNTLWKAAQEVLGREHFGRKIIGGEVTSTVSRMSRLTETDPVLMEALKDSRTNGLDMEVALFLDECTSGKVSCPATALLAGVDHIGEGGTVVPGDQENYLTAYLPPKVRILFNLRQRLVETGFDLARSRGQRKAHDVIGM